MNTHLAHFRPDDYEEVFDETYQVPYYRDKTTGEVSWTRPSCLGPLPPTLIREVKLDEEISNVEIFTPGAAFFVHGLKIRLDLNGMSCNLVDVEIDTGRCRVRFANNAELVMKRENLCLRVVPDLSIKGVTKHLLQRYMRMVQARQESDRFAEAELPVKLLQAEKFTSFSVEGELKHMREFASVEEFYAIAESRIVTLKDELSDFFAREEINPDESLEVEDLPKRLSFQMLKGKDEVKKGERVARRQVRGAKRRCCIENSS